MDKKDLTFTVFNLGVIAREERQFATVQSASNYFYEVIYTDIYRQYESVMDDVLIISYADYLTSIALLGYVLPYVCDYDDNFKDKLVNLILTRVKKPKEVSEFEEIQRHRVSAAKEGHSMDSIY
jgi:hypothetical protein